MHDCSPFCRESCISSCALTPWPAAKLSGGMRPSELYSRTSALLFAGKPLPDRYDLDTNALRNREAWVLVEVVDSDGVLYNWIAQLFPYRIQQWPNEDTPRRQDAVPAMWEHGEAPAGARTWENA